MIAGVRRVWRWAAWALAVACVLATPALAQEAETEPVEPDDRPEIYEEAEAADDGGRWSVGGFGGELRGATNIGASANDFFRVVFEQDTDTLWGLRGGVRVWWRLAAEVEYVDGAEPGIRAVLTDLQGRDRTTTEFADLQVSYVAGSLRYDVTRALVTPFLTLGVAAVDAGSDDLELQDDAGTGVLFGGGLEAVVPKLPIYVRVDIRGLRTDLGFLGEEVSRGVTNQVVWTVGAGVRF